MFTPAPSEHELAAAGLTLDDLEAIEVWPDSERAYNLLWEIQTQWRTGAVGATGLDYNVLFHKMDRMRLEPVDFDELEAQIRVMEFAALEVMNQKD